MNTGRKENLAMGMGCKHERGNGICVADIYFLQRERERIFFSINMMSSIITCNNVVLRIRRKMKKVLDVQTQKIKD